MSAYPRRLLFISVISFVLITTSFLVVMVFCKSSSVFEIEESLGDQSLADRETLKAHYRTSTAEETDEPGEEELKQEAIRNIPAKLLLSNSVQGGTPVSLPILSKSSSKLSKDIEKKLAEAKMQAISEAGSRIAAGLPETKGVSSLPVGGAGQGGRGDLVRTQGDSKNNPFLHPHKLQPRYNEAVVYQGTQLEVELMTSVTSEAPGMVKAILTKNVFAGPNRCVLPRASQALGRYNVEEVEYGDSRLNIMWFRLILPNGQSLSLDQMGSASPDGSAGVVGKVDNRWGNVILSSVITSVLGVGIPSSTDSRTPYRYRKPYRQEVTEQIGTNLMETGQTIVDRELQVRPVITVDKHTKLLITVEKDIILPINKEC